MKFNIRADTKRFPAEVVIDRSVYIRISDSHKLVWHVARGHTMLIEMPWLIEMPCSIIPDVAPFAWVGRNAEACLLELHQRLGPIPQVKTVPGEVLLFKFLASAIHRCIAREVIDVVCASRMSARLNVRSLSDMQAVIQRWMPNLNRTTDYNPQRTWQRLCRLLILDILNPSLSIEASLRQVADRTSLLGISGALLHSKLSQEAQQVRLFVRRRPMPYERHCSGFSRFVLNEQQGVLTLTVLLHYRWIETPKRIIAELGRHEATSPVCVMYRLYKDNRFTIVIGVGDEVELPMEPISTDIPVPAEMTLFVPILNTDMLEMMVDKPVTLEKYAVYDIFSNVFLPVRVSWKSSEEARFVLDTLSTVLLSDVVIADCKVPHVNAKNGGHPDCRFGHPQVLKAVLTQVLLNQYVGTSPVVSLNRLAYGYLWLHRLFTNVPCVSSWGKVTVGLTTRCEVSE